MIEFNEVEESETCREAKAWLLAGDGVWKYIGEQTEGLYGQPALDLIEQLYARGAVKVWAYNIQSLSGESVRIAAEKVGFDTDTLETVDELSSQEKESRYFVPTWSRMALTELTSAGKFS